jgi:hypothetical protein
MPSDRKMSDDVYFWRHSNHRAQCRAWDGVTRGNRVHHNLGVGRRHNAHMWNESRERKGRNDR